MACCGRLHLSLTRRLWVSSTSSPWTHKAYYHIGRILSRLSKDQDTLDTQLAQTLYTVSLFPLTSTSVLIHASRQLLSIFSNVLGTVALVFYTFPYLGIIFAPLSVLYYLVSAYYRRSSVETKRLDSLLRSALYASYQGNGLKFVPIMWLLTVVQKHLQVFRLCELTDDRLLLLFNTSSNETYPILIGNVYPNCRTWLGFGE